MPILHVFIVIPVPERQDMIPRTYDTLATLGQQNLMVEQTKLIKKANDNQGELHAVDDYGRPTQVLPAVVEHANEIKKPDMVTLESEFGIKVCIAMLNACGPTGKKFACREIYIHSKLLLIDDTFFTLGSANMNVRSMVSDSEINIATVDPLSAKALRKQIWGQLTDNAENCSGDQGLGNQIAIAFDNWKSLMEKNKVRKDSDLKIKGFILPLRDERSSTLILG